MFQISSGLFAAGNSVLNRDWTSAQTANLWKDEPHPVTHLCPDFQFGENPIENSVLGKHETLQVIWVVRRVVGTRAHGLSLLQNKFIAIGGASVAVIAAGKRKVYS